MKVTVTQEDIDHGKREECRKCPIARAMMRELGIKRQGPHRYVSVYGDEAEGQLGKSCEILTWDLPLSAKTFQRRFDDGFLVKPFQFEAEIAE